MCIVLSIVGFDAWGSRSGTSPLATPSLSDGHILDRVELWKAEAMRQFFPTMLPVESFAHRLSAAHCDELARAAACDPSPDYQPFLSPAKLIHAKSLSLSVGPSMAGKSSRVLGREATASISWVSCKHRSTDGPVRTSLNSSTSITRSALHHKVDVGDVNILDSQPSTSQSAKNPRSCGSE